jgi:hypothetical protein
MISSSNAEGCSTVNVVNRSGRFVCWTGGAALSLAIGTVPARAGAIMQVPAGHVHAGASVQRVSDQRCSWRNGKRQCHTNAEHRRKEGHRSGYGYAYGRPRAEFYPFGSEEWWQAMEREGRVFQGPN